MLAAGRPSARQPASSGGSAANGCTQRQCRTSQAVPQVPQVDLLHHAPHAQAQLHGQAAHIGEPAERVMTLWRRTFLQAMGAVLVASQQQAWMLSMPAAAGAAEPLELYVLPPGGQASTTTLPTYTSITAALDSLSQLNSSVRAVIRVMPGRYPERLVVTRPGVTIEAYPKGAVVEVVWTTSEPYQPVLECTAQDVVVRGLRLRHASKSVANNYGVYLHDGTTVVLDGCDISSSTGTGVGLEASSPTLIRCRIHDCANHGVAVFGPLDPADPPGGGTLQECELSSNKGEGVLVRGGAEPEVTGCTIGGNGGWGISLQDCGGRFSKNQVAENGRGALYAQSTYGLDSQSLRQQNSLKGRALLA